MKGFRAELETTIEFDTPFFVNDDRRYTFLQFQIAEADDETEDT
ncbi:MAG: hypothetical protein ABIS29_02830 [Vicinamibacterales bacterium]